MEKKKPYTPSAKKLALLKKIEDFIVKYELTIAVTLLIIFGLMVMGIPTMDYLFISGMLFLAILYFSTAYMPFPVLPDVKHIFSSKLSGIASFVIVIGILFSVMNWPMYNEMLKYGLIGSSFALIYGFLKKEVPTELKSHFKRFRLRIVILLIIGGALYLTPRTKLVEFGVIEKVITETPNN